MRKNFHSRPEIRGISYIQVLYLCAFFFTDCTKCLDQILSSNPNKSIVTSRLHEPFRHFDVRHSIVLLVFLSFFGAVVLSLYIQINCFLLEMHSWLEKDEDKKSRLQLQVYLCREMVNSTLRILVLLVFFNFMYSSKFYF